MEPELCTSDFIYFIEQDALLDNMVSGREPQTPVDAHDLASMPVNGWQRVMLSAGYNLPRGARSGSSGGRYNENAFYIVAMPDKNGKFKRPYGDPEFELEALISF